MALDHLTKGCIVEVVAECGWRAKAVLKVANGVVTVLDIGAPGPFLQLIATTRHCTS